VLADTSARSPGETWWRSIAPNRAAEYRLQLGAVSVDSKPTKLWTSAREKS
jgi:hypothetical protein